MPGVPEPTLDELINLAGHDADTELPCLCKRCLPGAPATATAAGIAFARSFAVHDRRVLHFWYPAELEAERAKLRATVSDSMRARAKHARPT